MHPQACCAGQGPGAGRRRQRAPDEPIPTARAPTGGKPSAAKQRPKLTDDRPVSEQVVICTVCGYCAGRVAPAKCPLCGSDRSSFRSYS